MSEYSYATESTDLQSLLSLGFSEAEATRLVHMRDHVAEQTEYREMLQESRRFDFMRWLNEHNRINH